MRRHQQHLVDACGLDPQLALRVTRRVFDAVMRDEGRNGHEVLGGPGCVLYIEKTRSMGFESGVFDAAADNPLDPQAGRWAAVCLEHMTAVQDDRRALSAQAARETELWCSPCTEAHAGTA